MKYFPVSDLHLEFFPNLEEVRKFANLIKNIQTDNLCLCGDVCSWHVDHVDKLFYFLDEILPHFNKVWYLPGNHEYYGCRWGGSYVEGICEQLSTYATHLKFAASPTVLFNDSDKILLSTLWYPSTPDTFLYKDRISDFEQITGFSPRQANEVYIQTKELIAESRPNIWLLHHLPTYQSIADKYKNNSLNCYYVGSLEREISEYGPELIFHGHTHDSFQYTLPNNTQVICNPYGYFNYQTNSNFKSTCKNN